MEAGNDARASALPQDWAAGTFLGRANTAAGPSPILLVRGELYDMSRVAPTVSALVERGDFSGQGGLALGAYVPRAGDGSGTEPDANRSA